MVNSKGSFLFLFFQSLWCHRGVHFSEASMPYTPHFQTIQWSSTEHSVKSYWSGWSWKIFCIKSYEDLTGTDTQSNKLIQMGNRICFTVVSGEGLKIVWHWEGTRSLEDMDNQGDCFKVALWDHHKIISASGLWNLQTF